MRILVWVILLASALAFLLGVIGNLIQFGGASGIILLPPLAWWRGAIYLVLLAVGLQLIHVGDKHQE